VLLRIVLLRHGVRAPTKSPAELAPSASQPWPAWPVAPGQLTPHGADLMRALGAWYRRELEADALLPAGCAAAPALTVIADSTPRNHDSAAALVQGLLPGCAAAAYRAFAPGQPDPLFGGLHKARPAPAAQDPQDPPAPTLTRLETAALLPALADLQQVLFACAGPDCLRDARAAGKTPLPAPCAPTDPDAPLPADCARQALRALKTAGSLAENIMLEQAQGMPADQVGWGRADAATVGRLVALHNLSFAALQKNDALEARRHASNLLAHVAATLQARAGATPTVAALGDAGTRVLFLVGHDTNLASLAGLLRLDWHDARQPDDYPPGGALVFDLVGQPGQARVRVRSAMPTLAALRAARLAGANAPLTHALALPGCDDGCAVADFLALVARRIDADEVAPASALPPLVSVGGAAPR